MLRLHLTALCLAACLAGNALSQAKVKAPTSSPNYTKHTFTDKKGKKLVYYLMKPKNYDATRKYPLVLALHGRGGNTTAATVLGGAKFRDKYPCFVLAPAVPRSQVWGLPRNFGKLRGEAMLPTVFEVLAAVAKEYSIDPRRLYVTGQSMGGFGTFAAIAAQPKMFAAAVPICGGWTPADAKKIALVNLWIFHGANDKTVPAKRSQEMVEALKNAGGSPKYTEYEGVGHNSWTRAYKTPALWKWIFSQSLKQ